MARWRFLSVALLALALTGNASQTGRTAGESRQIYASGRADGPKPDCSCVIYSLSERGFDADVGKWIADTVREVIEPESWRITGSLRYYAPKNILVVNHTTAAHGKIERFLKEMKTSLPKGSKTKFAASKKTPTDAVVPASYRQLAGPPEPSAYPVPAPVKAPKHLFHFLIRYEGEGIIDDNVVKFMKVQNQGEKKEKSEEDTAHHGYYPVPTASAPSVSCAPCVPPTWSVPGAASMSSQSWGNPPKANELKSDDKKKAKQPQ